jgi:zinc protease
VVVPPLRFTDRTLANGLRVLLLEDHSTPLVAISVGYHVGGKDDPPGRSGFAHLFEHLMFKGTANMPPQMMDRLTEDVGGYNNAFTAEDATIFYEVVPSNYVASLLWAEADRMASLNVDEANFRTERQVVLGEYGQTVLADPYGMLPLLIERNAYTVHPYRRSVIGSPADLNAASLEDVRRFHQVYYRPDNAVLAVVGDFDPDPVNRWIDQYFGRVPRPASPIPRVTVVEPPQTAERRVTEYRENVPLPAVAFVYHAVAAAAPDAPALQVAEAVLATGESSRLYRALVYEQQLASEVSADAELREQPGLFTITAVLNAGKQPQAAGQALDSEIRRLQSEPVSLMELDKAKTQLVTGLVREREADDQRAIDLVRTTITEGSPQRVNTRAAELQAVTAADLQRAVQRYLIPANRTVIEYLPAAMQAGKSGTLRAPAPGRAAP